MILERVKIIGNPVGAVKYRSSRDIESNSFFLMKLYLHYKFCTYDQFSYKNNFRYFTFCIKEFVKV